MKNIKKPICIVLTFQENILHFILKFTEYHKLDLSPVDLVLPSGETEIDLFRSQGIRSDHLSENYRTG